MWYGGGIGSIISMTTPKDTSTGKVKYKTVYYHYDRMGNVMNLTGAGGNQNAKYTYDAFGNMLQEKGAWAATNPYRFSTKETDSTGLIYFGARYYNPQVGRWITKDPMGMVDGPNMYAYVLNNPVNYIDEWGNYTVGGSGSGLIGGVFLPPVVTLPGPDVIGGLSVPINPNGTEKGNKTPTKNAGIKEEANNPTAQINKAEGKEKPKGKEEIEEGKKDTPDTAPDSFVNVRGKKGKRNIVTGEIVEKDPSAHGGKHYEVYKNIRDYLKGRRSMSVKPNGSIIKIF